MKKLNGKRKRDAFTDPSYVDWREAHKARVFKKVSRMMDQSVKSNETMWEQAYATGLSMQTIRRYRRKEFGTRGPMLMTYLLLRERE